MRTVGDLIAELDDEAKTPSFIACAIVVSFKNETKLVFAHLPDRQEILDGFVDAGGEPIAMLALVRESVGAIDVGMRPLREYDGAPQY